MSGDPVIMRERIQVLNRELIMEAGVPVFPPMADDDPTLEPLEVLSLKKMMKLTFRKYVKPEVEEVDDCINYKILWKIVTQIIRKCEESKSEGNSAIRLMEILAYFNTRVIETGTSHTNGVENLLRILSKYRLINYDTGIPHVPYGSRVLLHSKSLMKAILESNNSNSNEEEILRDGIVLLQNCHWLKDRLNHLGYIRSIWKHVIKYPSLIRDFRYIPIKYSIGDEELESTLEVFEEELGMAAYETIVIRTRYIYWILKTKIESPQEMTLTFEAILKKCVECRTILEEFVKSSDQTVRGLKLIQLIGQNIFYISQNVDKKNLKTYCYEEALGFFKIIYNYNLHREDQNYSLQMECFKWIIKCLSGLGRLEELIKMLAEIGQDLKTWSVNIEKELFTDQQSNSYFTELSNIIFGLKFPISTSTDLKKKINQELLVILQNTYEQILERDPSRHYSQRVIQIVYCSIQCLNELENFDRIFQIVQETDKICYAALEIKGAEADGIQDCIFSTIPYMEVYLQIKIHLAIVIKIVHQKHIAVTSKEKADEFFKHSLMTGKHFCEFIIKIGHRGNHYLKYELLSKIFKLIVKCSENSCQVEDLFTTIWNDTDPEFVAKIKLEFKEKGYLK